MLQLLYHRRIAGEHGHFTKKNYENWLKTVKEPELARALSRLAQLNQSIIYLFWRNYVDITGWQVALFQFISKCSLNVINNCLLFVHNDLAHLTGG